MTRRLLVAAVLFLGAASWAGPAGARGPGGPCADDAARLCSHVPPGPGHVLGCLRTHYADLSAECAHVVGRSDRRAPSFQASCGADIARLCPTISPGRGRVLRCLRRHERDLTLTCRQSLEKLRR